MSDPISHDLWSTKSAQPAAITNRRDKQTEPGSHPLPVTKTRQSPGVRRSEFNLSPFCAAPGVDTSYVCMYKLYVVNYGPHAWANRHAPQWPKRTCTATLLQATPLSSAAWDQCHRAARPIRRASPPLRPSTWAPKRERGRLTLGTCLARDWTVHVEMALRKR